ncbi:T. brucei spp.-specific protein [Trypanosoma brucei gambiense DAL972]|uniref:T. brucei spp.-specific protein n=1 Tax=Trypanosoma brucei gambiense (strain MHOM/CI/86/DAL972) TaxID=679716 RepID=D0A6V6_TRYB9|nr:T. brucei spp.-specific protein [Trypanosoma brucei gambiense DAL972]CBH17407.1 T. brucei spp.-specific protein [Trypanosoma brucei gambiense DAL972]|eukprot:XP_011779671.1 T. brucei spp.-specific protein [Trypanosoma brucei gambiense DAL972]
MYIYIYIYIHTYFIYLHLHFLFKYVLRGGCWEQEQRWNNSFALFVTYLCVSPSLCVGAACPIHLFVTSFSCDIYIYIYIFIYVCLCSVLYLLPFFSLVFCAPPFFFTLALCIIQRGGKNENTHKKKEKKGKVKTISREIKYNTPYYHRYHYCCLTPQKTRKVKKKRLWHLGGFERPTGR